MTKPNQWLNEFAKNVTSQHGEDGIIEKALEIIGENNKWCVEFGSWDGKNLNGGRCGSGTYLAVIKGAGSRKVKRVVIMSCSSAEISSPS